MSLKQKNILGIPITNSTKKEILEEITKYFVKCKVQSSKCKVKNRKPLVIFTPNPEIIMYAQKDEEFRQIVKSAQINIPDGHGISWALAKLYRQRLPTVSGADFMVELLAFAEKKGLPIGLIGGKGKVAVKALECLLRQYPKLKGYSHELPVMTIEEVRGNCQEISRIAKFILEHNIKLVFIALGFPKQEYFIAKLKSQMSKLKTEKPLVLMAVGGTFDYLAGAVPRAPLWMRERGLEWLFRLLQQPERAGRQLKGLEFFYRVITR